MTRLFRLLILAVGLALAGPAAAEVRHPKRDFTDAMIQTLATDPARADELAREQITRIDRSRGPARDLRRAAALWVQAQAQFRLGDAETAAQLLTRAEAAAPEGREGARLRAQAALLRGLIVRANGDFGGALQLYRQAQRGFIAVGDDRGHALALQSVGILYSDAADSASAIRYLTLAQNVYDDDDLFRLSLNINLGVALQYADRYRESAARFTTAMQIADRIHMAAFARRVRLNLARSLIASGDSTGAERTLASLSSDAAALGDLEQREILQLRAVIARGRGQAAEARALIDRSLAGIDPKTTSPPFKQIHAAAYDIYSSGGRSAEALAQLEAMRRLEAQEAQLTASNRASLLAAQFQFSAQNARIDKLKAERLARDIAYQRMMALVVGGGGLIALGMLAALLVQALRARNRARRDGEQLREVNVRLERALAAKTEFLASTSHELRTPLNGILGMTQIMLADSTMAPRMRAQVELVHDAGSTMRSLVDDILDVAKTEHGRFVISPTAADPRAIAEKVVALFSEQAERQGIALHLGVTLPDQMLMLDPERVNQILFNLVGNALKFTHQGSINVDISEEAASDAHNLVIAVRDTGIGIAPEWHDAVFDMFKQVDNTRTRNYGGTGLGLAICRQLARAMGGDITLESAEGEGSCFTVRIPWHAAHAPAVDADDTDAPASPAIHSTTPGAPIAPALPVMNAPARSPARPAAEASGHLPGGPAVLVIAAAPLRSSMLCAIARVAGRTPVIAPDADGIADRIMAGMACLIDGESLDQAMMLAGEAIEEAAGAIIVAGTPVLDPAMLGRFGQARVATFSRNALIAALGACDAGETRSDDSGLHAAPDGISHGSTNTASQRRTA